MERDTQLTKNKWLLKTQEKDPIKNLLQSEYVKNDKSLIERQLTNLKIVSKVL